VTTIQPAVARPQDAARLAELRGLFPGLADGWARLDGPGGSQTPAPVLKAMTGYLRRHNANLGGAFPHSTATGQLVADSRSLLAAFLGAGTEDVGFGLNATMLNSHLAGQATRGMRAGEEIIVTALDHDANITPWLDAAADHDLVIRTIGVGADTRLDVDALASAIGPRTRIVAFPWACNATGTHVDVRAVTELAHAAGATAWADATHYLPHGPVNVADTGVDVLIGSAYKFFGPHLGIYYARRQTANTWRPPEAGTLPFESLAGLTAALGYISSTGWEFIEGTERALGERFLGGLPERWRLHGLPGMHGRTATFALTLPGHDPRTLAGVLADHRVAVTAGDFHAPAIMSALNLKDGALRVGILHYNTGAEIDRTLEILTTLAAR
jgi:cysteine desulfurase family protein (TIGR01976 family)